MIRTHLRHVDPHKFTARKTHKIEVEMARKPPQTPTHKECIALEKRTETAWLQIFMVGVFLLALLAGAFFCGRAAGREQRPAISEESQVASVAAEETDLEGRSVQVEFKDGGPAVYGTQTCTVVLDRSPSLKEEPAPPPARRPSLVATIPPSPHSERYYRAVSLPELLQRAVEEGELSTLCEREEREEEMKVTNNTNALRQAYRQKKATCLLSETTKKEEARRAAMQEKQERLQAVKDARHSIKVQNFEKATRVKAAALAARRAKA